MSVCGQSGQVEDDSASEEVSAPNRDLYKQKPASKVVRVLTVLAYLLFVSLAAILLSVYYVCVWKSPDLPLEGAPELSARRSHEHHYVTKGSHHHHRHIAALGGGDITINGTSPPPLSTDNTTSASLTEAEPEDATAPSTHTSQDYTTDDIDVYNDTNNVT